MVTVNLVFMVTVAGLDPLQMVLVGTALELSAFLFEIPTGVVADAVSRKVSVIIGHALIGLGQADAVGQSFGGPMVGALAKYVSIGVALSVSAVSLLPALPLYRKIHAKVHERAVK
jgi:uncharacterized membrane protein YczE